MDKFCTLCGTKLVKELPFIAGISQIRNTINIHILHKTSFFLLNCKRSYPDKWLTQYIMQDFVKKSTAGLFLKFY